MRPRSEQIFVKIMRNGFIPQLGICGPIPNPIRITRATAHSMIVAGIDVYQYFPENHYTEKLTLQTVFGKTEKEEVSKKPIEKKISEPMKPVELTGVIKEEKELEIVNTDENIEEVTEDEVEDDTEVDETTEVPASNTNNTQYNNKKKKKHR